jgi:hypothetical protein
MSTACLARVCKILVICFDALLLEFHHADGRITVKTKELRELQRKVELQNGEIGQLRDQIDDLNIKRGCAESIVEQLKKSKEGQKAAYDATARKHGLPTFKDGPDGAKDFLEALNKKVTGEKRTCCKCIRQL